MTAEILSLDSPRVSARVIVSEPHLLAQAYEHLARHVDYKAQKEFADATRKTVIYLTVEQVVEMPDEVTAA